MMRSSINVVDSVDSGPTFDQPQKPAAPSVTSHRHPQLYATLAEYTLNSPRSFPIDPASRNSNHPRRPSSPLRSIDEGQHYLQQQQQYNQPGPSKGYIFPSPHHSPAKENIDIGQGGVSMSPTSSSMGSTSGASVLGQNAVPPVPQQRLSASGRPRRSSPLLHEIQPPSRRLSAHQMLLLTPFGGPLPAALSVAGGMGMSRGSSSLGSGAPLSAPPRMGSGTGQSGGWPRRESGQTASPTAESGVPGQAPAPAPAPPLMGRESAAQPQPQTLNRFPPRARLSLGHAVATHSPLASTPMTTIFSQGSSEGGSSSRSREAVADSERNQVFMSRAEVGMSSAGGARGREEYDDEDEAARKEEATPMAPQNPRQRLLSATVAMTRSNSLPVLTLRELEALKEKDGELGIQRGGDWAWVSRETEGGQEDLEDTPSLATETSTNASTSTTSLVSPFEQPSASSGRQNPFTGFHDPFAPPSSVGSLPTVPAPATYAFPGTYTPIATSSDYHYSPTGNEVRRMSDAPPSSSSGISPGSRGGRRSVTDSRRPSVPNMLRQSIGGLTPRTYQLPHALPNTQLNKTPPQASYPQAPSYFQVPSHHPIFQPSYQPLAPPSTDVSPHGSPDSRPASRPRLLRYKTSPARYTGLGLNITVRPTGSGRNSGSDQSPLDPGSAGASDGRGSMGEQSTPALSRGLPTLGHWAEVDFIDPLAATADLAISSQQAAMMSRTSSSISPTAPGRDLPSIATSAAASSGSVSGPSSAASGGRASIHSAVSAPTTSTKPAFTIDVASRSYVSDVEANPTFKGRSRFESVDSAFPLMPGGTGGRLSVPTSGAGEGYALRTNSFSSGAVGGTELGEGIPRRGSLGMGTFAKLRRAMAPRSKNSDANENREVAVDEMGMPILVGSGNGSRGDNGGGRSRGLSVASSSGHWSERRGSWAENWTRGA
ncbi:hypothetical protein I316_03172 [Kwoniella heveanensis BCC8398]|uniref:Uncharacterized protein n=1 Tax=Kwoniella heveanensis BCC8398 TaxID=1296120 RepID=A0A1B9GVT3_9TREE|nr:hypothetical protein I316_03172 [Kwoniella heveanensis BCC8398]